MELNIPHWFLLILACMVWFIFTGGVQWQRTKPPIRDFALSEFYILDRVHERVSVPAGVVHRRRYPATERETTAVRPARLRCTKSARWAHLNVLGLHYWSNVLEAKRRCASRFPEHNPLHTLIFFSRHIKTTYLDHDNKIRHESGFQ